MRPLPIYTIGYGARDIEAFVAVLQAHQIAYLVDVRSAPYSRFKPEFSRQALEQHLLAHGIRYVFMGDTLGGKPDDPTCYEDGKIIYAKVENLPFYQEGIGRLLKAHQQQLPVMLMCSEGKPEMCHRSKLIGKTLHKMGIPVQHIDENDWLISQKDAELRVTGGQPSLFGDDFQQFTSRKRYRPGTEQMTEEEDA